LASYKSVPFSGCYATRLPGSGLELITQKWGHSLIELDLGWSTATQALDLAVQALADKGAEAPLRSVVSSHGRQA